MTLNKKGLSLLNSFIHSTSRPTRHYASHSKHSSHQHLPTNLSRTLARQAALDIHPEILSALSSRKPVVALETALVTNGMPPPANLETALKLESIVREHGAVPATIGIIGGRVKVGLTRAELERLADTEGNKNLVKVSARSVRCQFLLSDYTELNRYQGEILDLLLARSWTAGPRYAER